MDGDVATTKLLGHPAYRAIALQAYRNAERLCDCPATIYEGLRMFADAYALAPELDGCDWPEWAQALYNEEDRAGRAAEARLPVAICLLTRKPHRFDWWMHYHLSLGVQHFFIRVEDTPELLELLATAEFAPHVTVVSDTAGADTRADCQEGSELIFRQQEHVRRSLIASRCMGFEWLFHLDDDELLHLSEPLERLVASQPAHVSCLVFLNLEAIPSQLEAECAFDGIERFTRRELLSYRNGKAAGRTLRSTDWGGPHRFKGGAEHVVPLRSACALRHEPTFGAQPLARPLAKLLAPPLAPPLRR